MNPTTLLPLLAAVARVPEPPGRAPRSFARPPAGSLCGLSGGLCLALLGSVLLAGFLLAERNWRVAVRAAVPGCPDQQRVGPVVARRTADALMHQSVSVANRSIPDSSMCQTA